MPKQITSASLRLGMYVHEHCSSWADHLFSASEDDRLLRKVGRSGAPRVKAFFSLESKVKVFPPEIDLADLTADDGVDGVESAADCRFTDPAALSGSKRSTP